MEEKKDIEQLTVEDIKYLTIPELIVLCMVFIVGLLFFLAVAIVFVRTATAEEYIPASKEQILSDCNKDYYYTARQINELQQEYNACSRVAGRLGLELPEVLPIDLLELPVFEDAGMCSAHLGAAGYTRFMESMRLDWCLWRVGYYLKENK